MKHCLLLLALASPALAVEMDKDYTPDLREDAPELPVKYRRGDFVAVPIPISDPTLGAGLVGAGAYFYGQTPEQAEVQPASVTAVGLMYTDNNSEMYGVGHSHYWGADSWRLNAAVGYTDLNLTLAENPDGDIQRVDWNVEGTFLQAGLSRRITGNWYGTFRFRTVAFNQGISIDLAEPPASLDAKTSGLGFGLEFDSRDLPLNTYDGQYLEISALLNRQALGGDVDYEQVIVRYRTFHQLTSDLVLAADLRGCYRSDEAPLWDYCRVPLRGFPATDYMGLRSDMAQAELRWQATKRWGLVAFGGTGRIADYYLPDRDQESVSSYGVGIRYMVLRSKRINIRLDFARSGTSEAVHLSVGEAF